MSLEQNPTEQEESFANSTQKERERIQEAIEESSTQFSLKEKLSTLSSQLGRTIGASRLEASVKALEYVLSGTKEWPLLMGPLCPEGEREGIPLFSEYPSSATVCKVAMDLGDYGFTLDALIEAAGPDIIVRPKAYKNQLSRLLRHHGFFRKQVRQQGKRLLLWFHPDRCGISV